MEGLVLPRKFKNLLGISFNSGSYIIGFYNRDKLKRKTYWKLFCGICQHEYIDEQSNICFHQYDRCQNCRNIKIDLTGYKFGYSCEVLKESQKINQDRRWLVLCHCGIKFETNQTHILRKVKECRKCADKTSGRKQSGENHWNYNPKISDADRLDRKRNSSKFKTWRKKVLYRDNHTCQLTGKTHNLDVHHLDGYNWCIEKRFDINNGITLFKPIHDKFHEQYGLGNNTRKQFEEFKRNYSLLRE